MIAISLLSHLNSNQYSTLYNLCNSGYARLKHMMHYKNLMHFIVNSQIRFSRQCIID